MKSRHQERCRSNRNIALLFVLVINLMRFESLLKQNNSNDDSGGGGGGTRNEKKTNFLIVQLLLMWWLAATELMLEKHSLYVYISDCFTSLLTLFAYATHKKNKQTNTFTKLYTTIIVSFFSACFQQTAIVVVVRCSVNTFCCWFFFRCSS